MSGLPSERLAGVRRGEKETPRLSAVYRPFFEDMLLCSYHMVFLTRYSFA
jgi:hypothetical protein